ncbi:MAG: hypothetical protein IKB88_06910 [Clostridia bacterium]|nr:hypothetical protein [Clostridia bacterium]
MDTKELFEISANGYDCEQVEQYVALLKAQYKKLFDYAKATEGNNEKLKKICRALSDENKALKASGLNSVAAKSGPERIVELTHEIEKIAASLSSDN